MTSHEMLNRIVRRINKMDSEDKIIVTMMIGIAVLLIALMLSATNYYQNQLAVMVKHCESAGMVISHDRQSGVYTCANKADVGKVEKEKP